MGIMETVPCGFGRPRRSDRGATVGAPSAGRPADPIPASSVLASLMHHRATAAILAATGTGLTVLSTAGLSVWHCPVLSCLHLRCPGCGLTGAVVQWVTGHWRQALSMHPFAPLVPLALLLLAAAAGLPPRPRARLASAVGKLEARFGLDYWLAGGLIAFWLLRMAGVWPEG